MYFSIDTQKLTQHGLSLEGFLNLLAAFCNVSLEKGRSEVLQKKMALEDLLSKDHSLVLSDKDKEFVADILLESDRRLELSPVKDFYALALALQSLYPEGMKPGTTYSWRGTTEEIMHKLQALVVVHGFTFTFQQAVGATRRYVNSFGEDKSHMRLLKYFILKTSDKGFSSDLMSEIENNES